MPACHEHDRHTHGGQETGGAKHRSDYKMSDVNLCVCVFTGVPMNTKKVCVYQGGMYSDSLLTIMYTHNCPILISVGTCFRLYSNILFNILTLPSFAFTTHSRHVRPKLLSACPSSQYKKEKKERKI